MAQESLANSPGLRERFLAWARGTPMGQAVQVTPEQQQYASTLQAIQAAGGNGVDINRARPPVQMPVPQQPQPQSVDDMIRASRQARGAPGY